MIGGRFSKAALLLLPLLTAGAAYSLERPAASGIDACVSEKLEKFHGHTCAGSLMGVRLGLAAKTALKAAGGEGRLRAKYFSHSCPVDGIQVALGTTFGNRTFEIVDQNDHRLLVMAEKNNRQVEARLTRAAEEKGRRYREVKSKANALPVGSYERERLEKSVEDVIVWFKTAPDIEVVQVRVMR